MFYFDILQKVPSLEVQHIKHTIAYCMYKHLPEEKPTVSKHLEEFRKDKFCWFMLHNCKNLTLQLQQNYTVTTRLLCRHKELFVKMLVDVT
jgi:hypothetical protein